MVYVSLFGRCLYLLSMWVRHAEYWGWQKPWQARWYRVHRPRRWHGRIKFTPRNISWMQMNGNAYLGCVIVIQPTWRPKKDVRRLDGLTFKSRMPGELWHDVDDYRWASVWVAISAEDVGVMQLPNPAMTWMSHKHHKPSNQQVSYSIQIGLHIHLQHILLHLAKYIHWITFTIPSFHHTTSFMGECWI